MDNLDYDPHLPIPDGRDVELGNLGGDEEQSTTPNPRLAWIPDYSAVLHIMYTATLVTIYVPIISLVQVKFQNEKKSPFETSGFFMNLSIIALCIAAATSGILFYINHHSENSRTENFSLVHYMILRGVFSFFGILTPLSLILVLAIPYNHNWIRYLAIFVLFAVVAICNFRVYLKLNGMENKTNINMEYPMEDEPRIEAHQTV